MREGAKAKPAVVQHLRKMREPGYTIALSARRRSGREDFLNTISAGIESEFLCGLSSSASFRSTVQLGPKTRPFFISFGGSYCHKDNRINGT